MKNYVREFLAAYTPYKDYFNYEDGCVLRGCVCLYEATGERAYRDFVLDYLDNCVTEDGIISNYETAQYNIDSINSS